MKLKFNFFQDVIYIDNINIQKLDEETLNKRLKQLCNLVNNNEFYIHSTMIDNNFMRPVVNQYFLYLTLLPSKFIIKDSILVVQIKKNK
jgi:hypothetical protein